MDGWRVGRFVILAGGLGMVAGAALNEAADDSRQDLWNRGSVGSLALSLVLLGLAAWHFRVWGLGKLAAVGLLAAGGLQFTLVDFGDGDLLWEQGFSGGKLAALWVLVVSAAVVLVGVIGSFVELARSPGRRSEDVAASLVWWRKWGVVVVGGFVVLWVLGQIYGAISSEDESPTDTADEGDERGVQDGWRIDVEFDEDGGVMRNVHMLRTFSPLEAADVERLEGRLVWPETELDLCGVEMQSAGDGFVQIGNVFPAREECEPAMVSAFDEFGLPEAGCLTVRSGGIDEDYCAPLAVDDSTGGEVP